MLPDTPPASEVQAVPVIHPNAVFTPRAARAALGLKQSTLAREIRLGRLRAAKRAGRHFILGSWLLEWMEAGEVRRGARKSRPVPANAEQR